MKVRRLAHLRTSHPALSVNDMKFIHVDFEGSKRVLVWADPVVVVANFSDFTTANALQPGSEYFVPNWPNSPAGKHWSEMTRTEGGRDVKTGRHNREPVFAWEAKVYRLGRGDNF